MTRRWWVGRPGHRHRHRRWMNGEPWVVECQFHCSISRRSACLGTDQLEETIHGGAAGGCLCQGLTRHVDGNDCQRRVSTSNGIQKELAVMSEHKNRAKVGSLSAALFA